MAREPDFDDLIASTRPMPGDCIAGVGADVLDRVAARHANEEPPDTEIDGTEVV